ncbi:MAG: CRISPR system precrRNA processing endoribonuclease RAMP protein Cas6 [Magnetococcales bacterium]|nr:CRISPR system precrRNA processing endoribonuclease RAMP protein Cas6 [Magnetococcales bacterium]
MIDSFPAARYCFEWEVETPLRLPSFAGSALRGVFGAALRSVACLTRQRECGGCGFQRSCPYILIFETPLPETPEGEKNAPIAPHPYVIEPPPWGERIYHPGEALRFHLVLMGRGLRQLPLLILAWQRAMAHGVGPGNGAARLRRVELVEASGEREIFTPEEGIVREHPQEVTIPPWEERRSLPLHLLTPTRIQRDGSPLGPDRFTARDLLVALLRRVHSVARLHAPSPMVFDHRPLVQHAERIDLLQDRLTWRDWTRRSARQHQEMTLGGVVGSARLSGPLEPFWPYLHLGQWLHLGKNATFGMGQYTLAEGVP